MNKNHLNGKNTLWKYMVQKYWNSRAKIKDTEYIFTDDIKLKYKNSFHIKCAILLVKRIF